MNLFQFYIEQDLCQRKKSTKQNCINSKLNSKAQRTALEELRHMDSTIFKMAEKGGTVVTLNKNDYHLYTTTMLEDVSTYTKLTTNPSGTY